jgi:hypothetical protein
MPLTWLIEPDVFPETAARITAALDCRGIIWRRYHDAVRPRDLPPDGEPVLFWGSLGAAYGERVARRWTPGAIGDIERFHCSAYYPQLRGCLANADAVFTTVRALVGDPAQVLGPLENPERLFVRPDSPLKPFSGRELARSDLSLKALDHGYYYDDDDLPIVVSTPKRIAREWRFIVADAKVVAGCEYQAARQGVGVDVPGTAADLATEVAVARWQVAPLYVVDVGEVNGRCQVMELNPFSGADFYDCDADAIVAAATATGQSLCCKVDAPPIG